ncbi:hypothetical protein B6S44_00040 [Bosea sp. Tri-44]|nr:hypothetical protein B6S44_00040 [Bosea sp. Tri-44]
MLGGLPNQAASRGIVPRTFARRERFKTNAQERFMTMIHNAGGAPTSPTPPPELPPMNPGEVSPAPPIENPPDNEPNGIPNDPPPELPPNAPPEGPPATPIDLPPARDPREPQEPRQ